jgi:hypothetical protein
MSTFNVGGLTAVARSAATMSAVCTRYAAELRQAAAELRTQVDCDVPAWQLGRRVPPHAETMLHALLLHVCALTATLQDQLSADHGIAAMLQRPPSSPEKAYSEDLAFLLHEQHTFLSSSQSLLAQLRYKRGGAVSYLETSAGVLECIAAVTTATHDGNMNRVAEFASRVADDVLWSTPYFQHAKMVGAVRAMQPFQSASARASL